MPLKTRWMRPVLPLEAQPDSRVVDLLRDMGQTAFQGKNLSQAVRIWCEMPQGKVILFLGIAGAMMIVADVRETAFIASRSPETGVLFLGGGTPKNFFQQTEVTADMRGMKVRGHRYAFQVTPDAPHWEGLSGCTFEEAQSWGKISEEADPVILYCDSTLALPLPVTAVAQAQADLRSRRAPPVLEELRSSPAPKTGRRRKRI